MNLIEMIARWPVTFWFVKPCHTTAHRNAAIILFLQVPKT